MSAMVNSDVPRVAVVGLGYWGPNLVRNLVRLLGPANVMAVDQSLDRLASVCAQFPSVEGAVSLDQALNRGVDAVVVATPIGTHFAVARTALLAGCHVMVEKPLATNSDDARELIELADERSLTLLAGHTFLFSPRVERIMAMLDTNALGTIQYATSSRLNLGLHQRDANVIWDLAPHDFSILFHMLGESPVLAQTVARSAVGNGIPDVAFINLTFGSGVVAQVTVSWLAPRKVRNTVLVGDEKMLVYDDNDAEEPVKVYDKGVVVTPTIDFGEHQLSYRFGDAYMPYVQPTEPLSQELSHFVNCIHGVEVCRSDGRLGLSVVSALEAADRSWQDGGRSIEVALEPMLL